MEPDLPQSEPLETASLDSPEAADQVPMTTAEPAEPAPAAQSKTQRSRRLVIVAAVAAVLVGGVGAYALWHDRPLEFEVTAMRITDHHTERTGDGRVTYEPRKSGRAVLLAKVTIHNRGKEWETFESNSLRIRDRDKGSVEFKFMGFSGGIPGPGWSTSVSGIRHAPGDQDTIITRWEGEVDNTGASITWQIAPGASPTYEMIFIIPADAGKPYLDVSTWNGRVIQDAAEPKSPVYGREVAPGTQPAPKAAATSPAPTSKPSR